MHLAGLLNLALVFTPGGILRAEFIRRDYCNPEIRQN